MTEARAEEKLYAVGVKASEVTDGLGILDYSRNSLHAYLRLPTSRQKMNAL
jgi:hypothetical protein